MEYHLIHRSSNLKVIGKFPQLEKMFDGYHGQYRYEAWGLLSPRRHSPMEKVTGFKLYYHAKVIDWIAAAQILPDAGLFSKRFFDLLQNYRCMDSIVVDAEVNHHSKTYPYKFVHFPNSYHHFVDYSRSTFFTKDGSGHIRDNSFRDVLEYKNCIKNLDDHNKILELSKDYHSFQYLKMKELYLDQSKINLDFFRFSRTGPLAWVVSAKLKEAIESAGMTGMVFTPAEGLVD